MANRAHTTPASGSRRGFLTALAGLPLIGGGITLLGQPTAAAVPVSEALMLRYVAWIAREHGEALLELDVIRRPGADRSDRAEYCQQPMFWFPADRVAHAAVSAALPSTRAAVVLSAAGCDWRA